MERKHAQIELVGATCTSCVLGIEHMANKLPGIHDIWVDRQTSCIHVEYEGSDIELEKICDFVHRIGYQANIIQTR